jgi:hypothetical protein
MKRINITETDTEINSHGDYVLRGYVQARREDAIKFTDVGPWRIDTLWIPRSALRSHRTIERGNAQEGTADYVEIAIDASAARRLLRAWIHTGPIPQAQRPW